MIRYVAPFDDDAYTYMFSDTRCTTFRVTLNKECHCAELVRQLSCILIVDMNVGLGKVNNSEMC
jgi:hypothetical protein